ncbi:hypothetical protein PC9H_006645 [Pleurotus ostreatus]|uniref:Dolichyldiphosphatase n=1 Tax=Pleurotus ostreatus TaxID=5322 RepID=A0A8H6ZX23_PLEOS|nr:uncharacterized protein PC9H_006645 [Pleurotus ostreatus]KAF7430930.1 hypothetical protein PC9H_006645 [Pleurotus ostreatus]
MSGQETSLDLTHVLYDDSSLFSLALALITLSPILLMPAYAALCVQTRELTIIVMWAGQWACEGLNWVLKRAVKQQRPVASTWDILLRFWSAIYAFITGLPRPDTPFLIFYGATPYIRRSWDGQAQLRTRDTI